MAFDKRLLWKLEYKRKGMRTVIKDENKNGGK